MKLRASPGWRASSRLNPTPSEMKNIIKFPEKCDMLG